MNTEPDWATIARSQSADIGELERALEAAREDARRLAAALRLTVELSEDFFPQLIVGPHSCQLTLGHVINGALALHEWELAKGRLPL